MAVVKSSGSGRAFQVVLSEDLPAGTILQVAVSPVLKLLDGGRGGFVVCSILPSPTRPDRFPKSKVWGQSGETRIPVYGGGCVSDRFDKNVVRKEGVSKSFVDKEVNL